jgi:hypothetical protein
VFALIGGSNKSLITWKKWRARTMSRKWKLRKGKVLVVEDADTASLVIVARDLKNREDKIAALEEVLRKMRA